MKQLVQKAALAGATIAMAGSMLLPSFAMAATLSPSELLQGESDADVQAALGTGDKSLTVIVVSLIRSFLGLLGIAAVVIIVIGGFQWMTAGGDSGKVDEAKARILQGVIGMAIVLSAFAIAQFVIGALVTGVTG